MLLCQALLGGNAAKVPISSQDGRCFLKPENNMEFHVCSAAETWCVSVCECALACPCADDLWLDNRIRLEAPHSIPLTTTATGR